MRVRRIRPGDGNALREVRLRALQTDPEAFAATYQQAALRKDDDWEEMAVDAATGGEKVIFLAESDDGCVGMVGAFARPNEPVTRNLYGMWVAPEARSSGIGMKLVDEVLEWSKAAGAEEVKLWVVESNHKAVALYQRAGFVPTGEAQPLPSHPDLTDTRMRLPLS